MSVEPTSRRAEEVRDPSGRPRVTVAGVLERAIFEADDRSYVVAELVARDGSRHVVAGDLGGCSVGDALEVEGERFVHPRFGEQIKVWSARWIPPASREGVRRLLGSGAIRGVGPKTAERIVAHFGDDTLRVLNEEPGRLTEVGGVTKKRARAIRQAWQERRRQHEEHAFLAGLGLGPGMADRVRKALGERMAERLRENPWLLAKVVDGIGFRRADEVAHKLEVKSDAPQRLAAGIEFALRELADEGHVFAPRARLVETAQRLLSLPAGPIEDELAAMLERGAIVAEPVSGAGAGGDGGVEGGEGGDAALFLPWLHAAEVEVAKSLARRVGTVESGARVDPERALAWAQPRLGVALTPDQRAALASLFNQRTGVLTGGPGVGKTTIVRALVDVFERKGLRVALAAPTGRAARRLSEACERPAATIHRLLEFDPRSGRFARGRDLPLEVDVLIVDEASMIDLLLMRDLLRALPAAARLIVVGDADQLPSVGPGDVLRSLVECGRLPVARLTRILRQHEGSTIVRAAHAVLHGELPEFSTGSGEGAFFIERDNPLAAQRTVVEIVGERLHRRFGLDPLRQVQVLTPMNRGVLGVADLNEALKQRLNPGGGSLFGMEPGRGALAASLGPGDRVIQTRNDYELEVMNGEIGFVTARDSKTGETWVDFEDRVVRYPPAAVHELLPAYAITVHKAQGCEFEAVVLALSMQHFVLLRRNLLYTAITRARRLLVIVGAPRALRVAIEMGQVERRRSLLEQRLRQGIAGIAA